MKLSIVILCWNDIKVIPDCLRSIYSTTRSTEFEIIVSDNGSTDGSVELIKRDFPNVRVIENECNLRFAKGNNVGIQASRGEYVLILNPDTILHEQTIDKLIAIADRHPEAGAFGCRVLCADGTYQGCARPLGDPRAEWCAALGIGWLARVSDWFQPGIYVDWHGQTERNVGWLAGCFILVRGELLKRLGGFDERFFYYYEDTDLCRRIWDAGYTIFYTPEPTLTHLGGESTNKRFPATGFALDSQVTRYLYYYKYYGARGARSARRAILVSLILRRFFYRALQLLTGRKEIQQHLELLRTLYDWNLRVDPIRLLKTGEEPELKFKPVMRVLER